MSHPIEVAAALTLAAALAFAATVLPRTKPAPPADKHQVETVQGEPRRVVTPKTVTVEPLPPKTDAQRLEDVSKKADDVAVEQRALIDQVKQLTQEVKGK